MKSAFFATCGKRECISVKSSLAYTSFANLIVDFPNSEIKIKPLKGEAKTYNAEDVFFDNSSLVLRNVTELSGRDAVYDLETEQFSHF